MVDNNKIKICEKYHNCVLFSYNTCAITYVDSLTNLSVELIERNLRNPLENILTILDYILELYHKKTGYNYQNNNDISIFKQFIVGTFSPRLIEIIINTYPKAAWNSNFIKVLIKRNLIEIAKKILMSQRKTRATDLFVDIARDSTISINTIQNILQICHKHIYGGNSLFSKIVYFDLEKAKMIQSFYKMDISNNNYAEFREAIIGHRKTDVAKYLYSIDPIGIDNIFEKLFYENALNGDNILDIFWEIKKLPKICLQKITNERDSGFNDGVTEEALLKFFDWVNKKKLEGDEIEFN